ncbi:hypothetical protein DHD32_12595 [Arenibacter sp. TNZ]|uniref:hypothetical protein n=1 Tax=Arenibacter TaxID=178469 RepID=UPI000CD3F93C|nr:MULTISPECIES: hypothetical protein [Arenibacter]MCM4172325.1 hypothetical protein [Arenibacter sp. TNZ]
MKKAATFDVTTFFLVAGTGFFPSLCYGKGLGGGFTRKASNANALAFIMSSACASKLAQHLP